MHGLVSIKSTGATGVLSFHISCDTLYNGINSLSFSLILFTIGYLNNSLHSARKYPGIFVLGHYLFRKEQFSESLSFKKQIMSKDKYSGIFSRQIEAIVFIIFQFLFATRTLSKIEVEMKITWLITSELANQRARKVLLTFVWYIPWCIYAKLETRHVSSSRETSCPEKGYKIRAFMINGSFH